MNSKTAITILLLILALSILTIMMIVVNKGMDRRAMESLEKTKIEKTKENIKPDTFISEKTDLEKEVENKDYSIYPDPDLEREKDQARIRLEKLNILRGGEPGPTEEELNAMSDEEKAQLEAEAQGRLDRLNELRAANN